MQAIGEEKTDHCRFTNRPPSTNKDAPVTYFARSLARKTTGPAISSGTVRVERTRIYQLYSAFDANARDGRTTKSTQTRSFDHSFSLHIIRQVLFVDVSGNGTRKDRVRTDVVLS